MVLGGARIEGAPALEGHSDADALAHAAADAMLSAAGLGDIGTHFPDTDPAYKGADSIELLARVRSICAEAGFAAVNLSCTVICERPKLAPYAQQMRGNIARAAGIFQSDVGISFTTNERLGSIGRGEGIAAMCTALLRRI